MEKNQEPMEEQSNLEQETEEQVQEPVNEEQQGAETETPKRTKREEFESSIREKYPDLDEEGIYSHAMESYSRKKKDLSEMQSATDKIFDVMANDTPAFEFVEAIGETGDVEDALLVFPDDVLEKALERKRNGYKLDDQEKESKLEKHRKNMADRKAQQKAYEEAAPKISNSLAAYAKENNIDEDEVADFYYNTLSKLAEGEVDKQFLDMMNIDKIKEAEYQRGLLDGKNSKIEELSMKKQKGSGLVRPKNTETKMESKGKSGNPFGFMTE